MFNLKKRMHHEHEKISYDGIGHNNDDFDGHCPNGKRERRKNIRRKRSRAGIPGRLSGPDEVHPKELYYPKEAEKRGEQGKVIVAFVVEKDGSASNFKIQHHATPTLDAAAIEALKKMPKWKPGTIKGKNVRVRCVLPVYYKLQK